MEAQIRFKVPATAIALDLVGCLLIILGTLNLNGVELAFLPAIPGGHSQGWTLVIFGVVFATAATLLIIGVMLARRDTAERPPTADRRSR